MTDDQPADFDSAIENAEKRSHRMFFMCMKELDEDQLEKFWTAHEERATPIRVQGVFPEHDPLKDADYGIKFQMDIVEDEDAEDGIAQRTIIRDVPEHPDEPDVIVVLPEQYA